MCPEVEVAYNELVQPRESTNQGISTLLSHFQKPERLRKSIEWDNQLSVSENIQNWTDKYFYKSPKRMTIGAEIEIYILNSRGGALESNSLLESILENLPYEIWRDYYPYQLEIRTTPTESWEEMVLDYRKKLALAVSEFAKHNLYLAPVGRYSGLIPCGIHIHVDYPGQSVHPFERAWSAYPFVLFLASLIKSSPQGKYSGGRMVNTNHIGMIASNKVIFNSGEQKWKDWHYNKQLNAGRRRVKDVYTLEVRIFDTVGPRVFSVLAELYYSLMSRVKPNSFSQGIVPDEYSNDIQLTREMSFKNNVAFSPFFGLSGGELLYLVTKSMNMKKDRVEGLIAGETLTPELVVSDNTGWTHHTQNIHRESVAFSNAIGRWIGKVRVKVDKKSKIMKYLLNTYGRSAKGCNCYSCMKQRQERFAEFENVEDGFDILLTEGGEW